MFDRTAYTEKSASRVTQVELCILSEDRAKL